jgi:hypothetical protein
MGPVSGRPLDTTPEAWEAQLAILRGMGGSRRGAMAFRLTRLVREASRAGIRARHPEYDEDDVRRALFRLLHGDAATREVWPGRELLAP